jgi:hypothetical protein
MADFREHVTEPWIQYGHEIAYQLNNYELCMKCVTSAFGWQAVPKVKV